LLPFLKSKPRERSTISFICALFSTSTAEQLHSVTASIMGDISPPKQEHLLVLMPYAVNDILDSLKKRFPYIKITVHPQQRVNRKIISEPIPDGRDFRRTQLKAQQAMLSVCMNYRSLEGYNHSHNALHTTSRPVSCAQPPPHPRAQCRRG
jgi:hypothetical protein